MDGEHVRTRNGKRVCLLCARIRNNNHRKGLVRNGVQTHCAHGHAWTKENTLIKSDGSKRCRECHRISSAATHRRRREAALERQKAYYRENHAIQLQKQAEWRSRPGNADRMKGIGKRYRSNNKGRISEKQKHGIATLMPFYVRGRLAAKGLPRALQDESLVELETIRLKLFRLVREMRKK